VKSLDAPTAIAPSNAHAGRNSLVIELQHQTGDELENALEDLGKQAFRGALLTKLIDGLGGAKWMNESTPSFVSPMMTH